MRLFPEEEKRKKMMKKGLPAIFTLAWTPIVWMVLAFLLGPSLERLIPSWQVVVGILVLLTLLFMMVMLRLLTTLGLKISEKSVD